MSKPLFFGGGLSSPFIINKLTVLNKNILNTSKYRYFPLTDDFITNCLINSVVVATNRKKREDYNTATNRFNNVTYDLYNSHKYKQPIKNTPKLMYANDGVLFSQINNKPRYKDYSIMQILKILYAKHKITKFMYKDSIRKAKQGKKLNNRVTERIQFYYKTLVSHKGKTNISALERQQKGNRTININGYAVLLKKRTISRLNNHIENIARFPLLTYRMFGFIRHTTVCLTTYRNERVKTIYSQIEEQHKHKLIFDNSIFGFSHSDM